MPKLYVNVALLECADKAALEEVLAAGLAGYVVRRVSDTAAIIDHARGDDIVAHLRKRGYTPKVTGA
jgi:hypothetical protein